MTPATPDRERGAAVVLAMLLAALAAAVAASVFADQQRWSRTVEHRRDQVQAQALVQAGVQWGRQILYEDKQRSSIDHLREPWAMALPAIPLDNGEVRGSIADAQARLNVIALGDSGARANVERARLQRLFVQRGGPVGAIDAIAAWINRNTTAADGQPLRVAELADVKDVSPSSLANVAPFLTALPAGTPVNVNTAPPEVLAAMVDKLGGPGSREARCGACAETVPERLRIPGAAPAARAARRRRDAGRAERLLLRDDRSAAGSERRTGPRIAPATRRRLAGRRVAGRRIEMCLRSASTGRRRTLA